jgi:hypothetical protein
MSIHVSRNSFNAGEISPLMDARVDEGKYSFSCRILENFIPKIYGGAFRRPGMLHVATQHDLAEWTERTEDHSSNLYFDGENFEPLASDDDFFYEVGSLWLRNVRTVYRCTSASSGSATWDNVARHDMARSTNPSASDNSTRGFKAGSLWKTATSLYRCTSASGSATWESVSAFSFLNATVKPDSNNDSGDGFEVGSIWHIGYNGATWRCTNASVGGAVWQKIADPVGYGIPSDLDDSDRGYIVGSIITYPVTGNAWIATAVTPGSPVWSLIPEKKVFGQSEKPGTGDDSGDGFAVGSIWQKTERTLYECADNTSNQAVWVQVSGSHETNGGRSPNGSDSGTVGKIWINQRTLEAWELTGLEGSKTVRLFDFNVSATTRYVLEMGDGYLRIWNDDATRFIDRLNSPYNLPLQLATPYAASEIFDVQIAQLGNLAYFAHPAHPPQKLERIFDASFNAATFRWSQVDWSFPAFRDWNNTGVTATPSATSGTFSQIRFTDNPFTETLDYSKYTGARIALSQKRPDSQVKLSLSATANSSSLFILGDFEVFTYGTANGTLRVQERDASGNWVNRRAFAFSAETNGRNIVFKSVNETVREMRLSYTHTSGSHSGIAYLEAADSRRIGYARIWDGIPFEDSLPVVSCAVELAFDSTAATTEWAIEAWAKYAGYPRSVCFHEQRLWFGGTELQPNTIWASATNDFENFRRGAFDSDSIAFTLAAQEGSAVQSLVSHDALVIFTQSEEWTAATSQQTAITPSNIFVRRQSRFGSAHRQAFIAANNLLFVQRGSRKLRQFTYSGAGGGGQGQASDLTLLAEHVTQSGIRQLAFQQQPDPIIWAVREDGVLLSLTYEIDQNVIAWARHTTDGTVESVAVTYGDAGEADEVWLIVNRNGDRRLERLDSGAFAKLEEGTTETMVYLDAAKIVTQSASTAVSGLSHLNGETVAILADGAVQAGKTVSAGAITLDQAASTVVVGIPYVSKLQPSKVEIDLPDGTAQGRKHTVPRATLNLWKTYGVEYADASDSTESKWFPAQGKSTNTSLGEPEPLYTGTLDINNLSSHKASVDLTIRQTLPLPANILAIVPKIEVHGN